MKNQKKIGSLTTYLSEGNTARINLQIANGNDGEYQFKGPSDYGQVTSCSISGTKITARLEQLRIGYLTIGRGNQTTINITKCQIGHIILSGEQKNTRYPY